MPSKQQKRANKAEQKQQDEFDKQKVQEENDSWDNGIDKRGIIKNQLQNEKQEEKMRKKQEMKELIALEESSLGPGKKSKNSKKSKKDDLFLLNQSLANAPKSKAQQQKEKEERKKAEEQRIIEKEEKLQRELHEEKELQYKNIIKQDLFEDKLQGVIGTIDDALDILDSSDDVLKNKDHYKEFYEKQLIILKTENPNMRRNQYKEHIYKLWKRSPENPNNQK